MGQVLYSRDTHFDSMPTTSIDFLTSSCWALARGQERERGEEQSEDETRLEAGVGCSWASP